MSETVSAFGAPVIKSLPALNKVLIPSLMPRLSKPVVASLPCKVLLVTLEAALPNRLEPVSSATSLPTSLPISPLANPVRLTSPVRTSWFVAFAATRPARSEPVALATSEPRKPVPSDRKVLSKPFSKSPPLVAVFSAT